MEAESIRSRSNLVIHTQRDVICTVRGQLRQRAPVVRCGQINTMICLGKKANCLGMDCVIEFDYDLQYLNDF